MFSLFWIILRYMFLIGFIGYVFVGLYFHRKEFDYIFVIWKRFTARVFFETLGVLVIIVVVSLILLRIPSLDWGWWTILTEDGDPGNVSSVMIQEAHETSQSETSQKFHGVLSISIRLFPAFILSLMMFGAPFLAKIEEKIFRKGRQSFKEVFLWSCIFGISHLAIGIPLAGALALILAGFLFASRYNGGFNDARRRGLSYTEAVDAGTLESTTYNALFNVFIFAGLLVSSLVILF